MTPTDGSQIVFRWELVLVYTVVKFLQGGSMGGVGFLNNFRTYLWIPIQQYTTKETEVCILSTKFKLFRFLNIQLLSF